MDRPVRIPLQTPLLNNQGSIDRAWIQYWQSLENPPTSGGGGGTVTNTGGPLTAGEPVIGAGGSDIAVGTKSGNTMEFVSATGTATANYPLLYDAGGNAIARQPRGNTTVVQLADSTTNPTSGHLASFDANGNVQDAGAGLTTKGDLLGYGSSLARLPVGSNTQVLTADSTQSLGIKWAAASSGAAGGLVPLASLTASSSASLDFPTRNLGGYTGAIFQSDYDVYEIRFLNVLPATNNVLLAVRCSTDGGATYDSANNYHYGIHYIGSSSTSDSFDFTNPTSGVFVTGGVSGVPINSTVSYGGVSGSVRIFNPLSATMYKRFSIDTVVPLQSGAFFYRITGHGTYAVTTAVNACRIVLSSGNIASGKVGIYGVA